MVVLVKNCSCEIIIAVVLVPPTFEFHLMGTSFFRRSAGPETADTTCMLKKTSLLLQEENPLATILRSAGRVGDHAGRHRVDRRSNRTTVNSSV